MDSKTIEVSSQVARALLHSQNPLQAAGREKYPSNRQAGRSPTQLPISASLLPPAARRERQTPRSPVLPPSTRPLPAVESELNVFSIRPACRTSGCLSRRHKLPVPAENKT